MPSYINLEKNYKKRIEELFEDFLHPKDECLSISAETYQVTYDTVHFLSNDKNFNKNLYKALKQYTYPEQNKFRIDKKALFKLIPALYVEHYYMWCLEYLLSYKKTERSVICKSWDDISEDFQSAFERFYKGWDKCSNEKYQFEYAEKLFRVIYEEYPELCTKVFPVVLFIFTDSYFDFCKICRKGTRDVPENLSDEMIDSILSLFNDRIYGEDFQYYLFSLIDIKPGYYSESSTDQAKILYNTLLKKSSERFEKIINNPKAIHVKYKDLLEKIGDELNNKLDDLNKKYNHLIEETYCKHQNTSKDLPAEINLLYKNFLDESKKELANIVEKCIDPQNNPTDKTELFLNDVGSLLDVIYNRFTNPSYAPYKDYMEARQATKDLIEDVILKKYNGFNKKHIKHIKTMQPCKNFEAVWRFMHNFSAEKGIKNYWVNYDMDLTLFVLNNATGWIDCMTILAEKNIPSMLYPYHIGLNMPFTSHHITSVIRRFFNTLPHNNINFDQTTYDAILKFYKCVITLYFESQKDCNDIFNDETFDKYMPDDFSDVTKYYDKIWRFSDLPSSEGIISLLGEYIFHLFE